MTTNEWYRMMSDKLREYKEVMDNRWDVDEQMDETEYDVEFIEWLGYDVDA